MVCLHVDNLKVNVRRLLFCNFLGIMNTEEDWWNNLTDAECQNLFRMSKTSVINIQAEIDHFENINCDRIDQLLLVSLWLLGNTKDFSEAERHFGVENVKDAFQNYLQKIVNLANSYFVWPTDREAIYLSQSFSGKYQFPTIVGVIGSLHIEVNVDGEENPDIYYNSVMKKHTVVLQVVCDSNLLLRNVCVGCPGGKSIKEILEKSPLYSVLVNADSDIVKNEYHLLGGSEHPQLNTLLTPYDIKENMADGERKFNLLHEKAMAPVEQTLRCIENRFPRINCVDTLNPEFASLIASAVCVLHNCTRIYNDNCNIYL